MHKRQLNREGRPINFKTVSEAAGLSTAWLYQHPEVKERIEYLREQSSPRPKPPPKTRASDASEDAIIATLRERVKRLEEDNRELRKQIEVAYGQIFVKNKSHLWQDHVVALIDEDSAKLNHPMACIMLALYTPWRNYYGSDRLTQSTVH
jgi:hypothetical protein